MHTHTHTTDAPRAGHTAVAARPVLRRARAIFAAILVPTMLATVAAALWLWPGADRPVLQTAAPG